jgi:hypothetical protein
MGQVIEKTPAWLPSARNQGTIHAWVRRRPTTVARPWLPWGGGIICIVCVLAFTQPPTRTIRYGKTEEIL